MITDEALQKLSNIAESLKDSGELKRALGTLKASVPVKFESINDHTVGQLKDRGITEEQAQAYIDSSAVMFEQSGGSKRLYISYDGNSAILVEGKRLLSAYPALYFDEGMKKFVEEVIKYE